MLALVLAAFPGAALAHTPVSDHVLLQVRSCNSPSPSGASGAASLFEPADGGEGRVCRGDNAADMGTEGLDYLVVSAASLDECKARCVAMSSPDCRGIEYSSPRCELWLRSIGTTAPGTAYTCLRYGAARARPCAGFAAPLVDTDLAGTMVAEVFAVSATECCTQCQATSACEGFAFSAHWQRCYLKSEVEGTFANMGIVTRLKSGLTTTPEPTPSHCEGFGGPMVGMDLAGDLLDEVIAATAASCCAACSTAGACQGFTFLAEVRRCYLKANVTGSYTNPGRVSQLKVLPTTTQPDTPPPSCDAFQAEMMDTDLAGLLLAEVYVASADFCCQACEGVDGCEGFSFVPDTAACYLKGFLTGTYASNGTLVRLKRRRVADFQGLPSCSAYGEALPDADVAGELLGTAPAHSAADCCGACAATPRCEAFVHLAATQSCYLKASVTGLYPRPGRVARLQQGLRPPSPTPVPAQVCEVFGPVLRDTDISGELLEEVTSTSPSGCCGACTASSHCEGFSFLQELQLCYLKANITGTYSQSGVSSQLNGGGSAEAMNCSRYSVLHEDTDVAGALLGVAPAVAPDGCCGACTRTPGCQGFAYVDELNQCYLKAHLTGIFNNPGVVARHLPHIGR